MKKSDAYKIIKHQHITEKARMLQELKNAKSVATLDELIKSVVGLITASEKAGASS